MKAETRMLGQPLLHSRMIMSRIVVEDKVKVNLFGGMSVKYTQKLQKFLMAMARQTLSDYFSIQSILGGKQGRGSIAFVIMSQCFRLSVLHRQPRLGTIQRLNLTLFVNTKYQRMLRGTNIQANHIMQFFNKKGIAAQLEGAD